MNVLEAVELADAPLEVVNLVMEGHLELRRQYAFPLEFINGTERTLWAEVNGIPVAVLIWERLDNGRIWQSKFSYSNPAARGTGAYGLLRARQHELAREDQRCRRIEGGVRWQNERQREILERNGQPSSVIYRTIIK